MITIPTVLAEAFAQVLVTTLQDDPGVPPLIEFYDASESLLFSRALIGGGTTPVNEPYETNSAGIISTESDMEDQEESTNEGEVAAFVLVSSLGVPVYRDALGEAPTDPGVEVDFDYFVGRNLYRWGAPFTLDMTDTVGAGALPDTCGLLAAELMARVNAGTAEDSACLRLRAGGVTLADLILPLPAFDSSAGDGTFFLSAPLSGTATASGTADNFQVLDRDRVLVFGGNITAVGGGGSLELTTLDLTVSTAVAVETISGSFA